MNMVSRTQATSRRLLLSLLLLVTLVLPGCFGRDAKDSERARMRLEVAELTKSYRLCLQKNEETPEKAKANCGIYKEAIEDLATESRREMIPDLLDRLSDRYLF
jgi:hypothetical protein